MTTKPTVARDALMELDATICKPLNVGGQLVTAKEIATVIEGFATMPAGMVAQDMITPELMGYATYHAKQECMNRLCQRWRKLGLVVFKQGRWVLTRGSWDRMQMAASRALARSGD